MAEYGYISTKDILRAVPDKDIVQYLRDSDFDVIPRNRADVIEYIKDQSALNEFHLIKENDIQALKEVAAQYGLKVVEEGE